jgi:hypothetical protein
MMDPLIFAIGCFVSTLCLLTVAILAWAALKGEDSSHN